MRSRLTRAWSVSVRQLQRDLGAVTAGLRGRRAPPFLSREGSAWPAPRLPEPGRLLRVSGVESVATDARRIWLVDPTGRPLAFAAGQFLTVLLHVDGRLHRRAYSICSDPKVTDRVAIAVRRRPGGVVSPRLVDGLATADELRVLGPSGSYGHGVDPARRAHHVFVSGGAGVGSNLSLATAVLAGERGSRCTFVLADRRPDRLMLRHAVQALADAHPDRMRAVFMVEEGPEGWAGPRGRLDAAGLARALGQAGGRDGSPVGDRWYLCGPPGMVDSLLPALEAWGVGAEAIEIERYRPPPASGPVDLPTTTQRVQVRIGDSRRTIPVPPGRTILDAARDVGVTLPSSCTLGGCGACRQRRVSGRVHHRRPNCLTAAEEASGLVLTCVAHPLGPVVLEPV